MHAFSTKQRLIFLGAIILLAVGAFVAYGIFKKETPAPPPTPVLPPPPKPTEVLHETIGISVEGRAIEAYTYGDGPTHLLLVGGIHGGYEWNSVVLAYQFIDYLKENPSITPKNLTVSIVPNANPDGVYRVVKKEGRFNVEDVPNDTKLAESGRFNAHKVDLNRNFDCEWQPKSMWKNKVVSAGTKAFSEPEAVAIRDFVFKTNPDSVIFWHSKANAVYASKCTHGILPKTLDIMNVYAKASGYTPIKSFSAYKTTGDSEGWLASINIPSVTVELETHENVEWERNLAGIKAIFKYYSEGTSTTPH